jgi:protein PhnA
MWHFQVPALASAVVIHLAESMSETTCPLCGMEDVMVGAEKCECLTCGHEWQAEVAEEAATAQVVKDAFGNVLADGDVVAMIKDLKLKGSPITLKVGMKSKPIRLVDGDHEISCRMEGLSIGLKACFVKKVQP